EKPDRSRSRAAAERLRDLPGACACAAGCRGRRMPQRGTGALYRSASLSAARRGSAADVGREGAAVGRLRHGRNHGLPPRTGPHPAGQEQPGSVRSLRL
ncbi:MAG: hypothetical protein AVDCRST_MAG31-83, partial [uncultured Sphingomonas sp.]